MFPARYASMLCAALIGASAGAQLPAYQNTETARPFRVEDASTIPRYALDLYVAPAVIRVSGTASEWQLVPGLTYGLVPRTHVELEVPIQVASAGATQVAGVRIAAQHTFNVERRAIPAVALEPSMLIAAGDVRRAHAGLKGMATKSFRWGRISANSGTTFGDEPLSSSARGLARWETGASVDRIFPRRGLLLGIEGLTSESLLDNSVTRWTAAAGGRYQLTTSTVVDLSVAHTFARGNLLAGWSLAAALSRTLAVPTMLPGVGSWSR